ncbi:MAG: uracil-DNA glycosylase [Cyanobacteria bacterium SID2]|nr:uracil-DNA glycosylase [Cyanobacteria bacterium SID2]MBP0003973.1 uracil-DNA glycosylase [Cyanobacteria bacterium SBC]
MSHEEQLSLFGREPKAEPEVTAMQFETIPTDANVAIPSGTYSDIDALANHCHECQRCGLGATRTHAVVGKGNPKAPIVLIGEGPGQNEDEQGLPFVGRSGELLDKILASVNLTTEEDVYICNVVKCRPPGNRNPNPDEIEACKPYLLEQIRLVDPKMILLTGAVAVKALLNEKRGITKIRGQWFEWENRRCMPIFHPAYLLRNPSREKGKPKWLMWQDMQAVKAKLDELRQAEES